MKQALLRATQRVLSRAGEDSVLRGEIVDPPIRAHIEHDVEMSDGMGNVMFAQLVVSIASSLNPQSGDSFSQDGVDYKLDAKIADNGYTSRFVLVKV